MNAEKKFILLIGGVVETARICGVTKGAVSQWHKRQRIPKGQFNFLKAKYPKEYQEAYQGYKPDKAV